VTHCSVGPDVAVAQIPTRPTGAPKLVSGPLDAFLIVGMTMREHVLGRRADLTRPQSIDPKQIVRPQHPTGRLFPAPDSSQLLHPLVQSLPRRPVCHDPAIVPQVSDPGSDLSRIRARRINPQVDRKLAPVPANRDEPARRTGRCRRTGGHGRPLCQRPPANGAVGGPIARRNDQVLDRVAWKARGRNRE